MAPPHKTCNEMSDGERRRHLTGGGKGTLYPDLGDRIILPGVFSGDVVQTCGRDRGGDLAGVVGINVFYDEPLVVRWKSCKSVDRCSPPREGEAPLSIKLEALTAVRETTRLWTPNLLEAKALQSHPICSASHASCRVDRSHLFPRVEKPYG